MIIGLAVVGVVAIVALVAYILYAQTTKRRMREKTDAWDKATDSTVDAVAAPTKTYHQKRNTNSNATMNKKQRTVDANFTDPWMYTTLKGHTGQVMDFEFSSNGKYIATCAEDRTILVWATKDIGNTKERKSFRINVEYDHAVKVLWSPDGRALIVYKYMEGRIEVYKVEKADNWFANPTKGLSFKRVHEEDIIGFGIACTGRFLMSCSSKTDLVVWDVRGNILEKIDTFLMNTYCAKISACGRFIAASGFASDVRVWEVKFCRIGEFQNIQKAFDLTGHKSGVYDVAFDQDTSHIATVCKDGTWKVFNTKIEYEKGESPRCLVSGSYESTSTPALIAISPVGEVVAISTGRSISLYSVLSGNLEGKIENIFNGNITCMKFDPYGKYLMASGDRFVRIFHNVPGFKVSLEVAKQKLKQTKTTAMRDRIETQIEEYEALIQKYK